MLPNFLIIGAGRTGTTSLYKYLKQHPQIFMSPVKEPRFFAYENEQPNYRGPYGNVRLSGYNKNLESYEALFTSVSDEIAIGEASVDYFYIPKAAERIKQYVPDMKLILILRQPVDRAYSQFWARVALGIEPLTDFVEAMEQEQSRIKNNWPPQYHYKQKSFYSSSLKRYLEIFDKDQIKIILHEDYHADTAKVFKNVTQFLEVDSSFVPDFNRRYNLPRGLAKYPQFNTFLRKRSFFITVLKSILPEKIKNYLRTVVSSRKFAPRPPLDLKIRWELTQDYVEDIIELQDLIEKDLSAWLK